MKVPVIESKSWSLERSGSGSKIWRLRSLFTRSPHLLTVYFVFCKACVCNYMLMPCYVQSTNFCSSAREAFNLLMRNLVRVVVLDRSESSYWTGQGSRTEQVRVVVLNKSGWSCWTGQGCRAGQIRVIVLNNSGSSCWTGQGRRTEQVRIVVLDRSGSSYGTGQRCRTGQVRIVVLDRSGSSY